MEDGEEVHCAYFSEVVFMSVKAEVVVIPEQSGFFLR